MGGGLVVGVKHVCAVEAPLRVRRTTSCLMPRVEGSSGGTRRKPRR